MDRIFIEQLEVLTIIGVDAPERQQPQRLLLDIELQLDLHRAGASDRLAETIDYAAVCRQVITLVQETRFYLLERLATAVAQHCLQDERVETVRVKVHKPDVVLPAKVAVEMVIARQRYKHA